MVSCLTWVYTSGRTNAEIDLPGTPNPSTQPIENVCAIDSIPRTIPPTSRLRFASHDGDEDCRTMLAALGTTLSSLMDYGMTWHQILGDTFSSMLDP